MRLTDVTPAHRRLLDELSGRISTRLEAHFTELPTADGQHIGIALRERGSSVVMELPASLLDDAADNPAARETLRTRIKARRDRMLFKPPPAALPKHIAPMSDPIWNRPRGGGGGGGYGRR